MSELPRPNTRQEQYLNAIATGNSDGLPTPITREEVYLDYIAVNGSGGDTTNYNALSNKPKINNVELTGNKRASDLNLQNKLTFDTQPTDDSSNPVTSGGVYNALQNKVDKETGKGLSTNDFTNTYKNQLDNLGTSSTKDYTDTFDEDGVEVTTGKAIADAINTEGIIDTPLQIMSFADGSDSTMKSCTVSIEPVQDLHGYDRPWAGGAGKNKCAPLDSATTVKGIIITPQSDGSVILNGTKTTDDDGIRITGNYVTVAGQQQIASIVGTEPLPTGIVDYGFIGYGKTNYITPSSSYAASGIHVYINQGTTLNNVRLYPQIEMGSARTAYESYSNICPIEGHDEVTVDVVGKNLLNASKHSNNANYCVFGGNIDDLSINGDVILDAGTYTFSVSDVMLLMTVRVKSGDTTTEIVRETYVSQVPFTLQERNEVRLTIQKSGFVFSDYTYQLEVGSTATAYEPYNPKSATYIINLGTTVYYVTIDIVTGVMTVWGAMDDLGTLTWVKKDIPQHSLSFFEASLPTIKAVTSGSILGLCSTYLWMGVTTTTDVVDNPDQTIGTYNGVVRVKDTGYNDAASFTTAMNGVQLAYELETPYTVQLTPTQVRSLLGTNNVWSDSGEMNKIIYTKGTTTLSLTIADLYNIIANLDARVRELEGEDEVDLSTMSDEDLDEMPEEEEEE